MATEREPARDLSGAHETAQVARHTVADLLGQPLPIARLLPLAAAAAGALADLHAAGRVHGSLHPGALLLGPGEDEVRIETVRARPTGALAYLAPEESDRSAAEVGPHSDLYSLGTILYTLAAGTPPFLASDPLEWVHCHVALPPEPVGHRRRELPPVVAEMIMRLLAKAPDGRYRSALGLSLDLERCWTSWRAHGTIAPFPLDALDQPGRLAMLPLYSRERELAELQAAFARTREGGRELVRVAGPAGVGKSALVRAFADVVAEQGGLLASGKVEEADRAIPYSGLATVVSNVVRQLVEAASDPELAAFRELLTAAVHPSGKLLLDSLRASNG